MVFIDCSAAETPIPVPRAYEVRYAWFDHVNDCIHSALHMLCSVCKELHLPSVVVVRPSVMVLQDRTWRGRIAACIDRRQQPTQNRAVKTNRPERIKRTENRSDTKRVSSKYTTRVQVPVRHFFSVVDTYLVCNLVYFLCYFGVPLQLLSPALESPAEGGGGGGGKKQHQPFWSRNPIAARGIQTAPANLSSPGKPFMEALLGSAYYSPFLPFVLPALSRPSVLHLSCPVRSNHLSTLPTHSVSWLRRTTSVDPLPFSSEETYLKDMMKDMKAVLCPPLSGKCPPCLLTCSLFC